MSRATRCNAERLVAFFLSVAADGCVIVGPLLWEPDRTGWAWHFKIVRCGTDGRPRWGRVEAFGEADRQLIVAALQQQKSLTVFVTNDECDMAQLCEELWPCDDSARIRADIEAKRAADKPRRTMKRGSRS